MYYILHTTYTTNNYKVVNSNNMIATYWTGSIKGCLESGMVVDISHDTFKKWLSDDTVKVVLVTDTLDNIYHNYPELFL